MENRYSFAPPRRIGIILFLGAILFSSAMAGFGIWQMLQVRMGLPFLFYSVMAIIGVVVLPLCFYRLYALWGAYYTLERDGLHIHWGLRVVDIPINSILWVYPASKVKQEMKRNVPLPNFRLPGIIVGICTWQEKMNIEYLASDTNRLLIVATHDQVYGISPNDPEAFLYVYSRYSELGSIIPIKAQSIHASFLITKVWNDRPIRYMILAGFFLSLILLGWVSFIIPTRNGIILGFLSDEAVPSARLFLLPFINSIFFLSVLLMGLFVYRRDASDISSGRLQESKQLITLSLPGRFLSILLFIFHIIATALFLFAVYFIQLPE